MSNNTNLADKAARDIIAQEVDCNLMVEAGAGSGKTSEMSNRILALVKSGYRQIEEIVAITFTNQAANELRERVRKTLEKEYQSSKDDLVKNALDNFHECYIGTIHSFCGVLLKERPIEARLDPEFQNVDNIEDTRIIRNIWEKYVVVADEKRLQLLKYMELFGIKEETLVACLQRVCENPDIDFTTKNLSQISFDEIEKDIEVTYHELRKLVLSTTDDFPQGMGIGSDPDSMDELQKTIVQSNSKLVNIKKFTLLDKLNYLRWFSSKSKIKVTQYKWGADKEAKAKGKAIGEEFEIFSNETIHPLLEKISVFSYERIIVPFAYEAREEYEQYKNSISAITFQDMLIRTADMLRDYPELRNYFQNKYKTILLDEFQDTDPVQAQIILYLTCDNPEERVWNKIRPKQGSLFVVGDPKQSIYMFRRADLDIYQLVKDIIIKSGGKFIELTMNFRSDLKLISAFNSTFDGLLSDKEGKDSIFKQVSFVEQHGVKKSLEGSLSGVYLSTIEAEKIADAKEIEGDKISRVILQMVNNEYITDYQKDGPYKRKIKYSDIMIICMKKAPMADLADRILRNGIPTKVIGGNVVEHSYKFHALAKCIKMLAYPEENAYLHAVITCGAFGIKNEDLVDYIDAGGHLNVYFPVETLISESRDNEKLLATLKKIDHCFNILKKLIRYSNTLSPSALTEKVIKHLKLIEGHLESYNNLASFSNFINLIERIKLQNIEDIWGLDAFVEEISKLLENGLEEVSELEGNDYNAVKLMNMHKTKGLEAPIIILANPYSSNQIPPSFYTEKEAIENGCIQYYGHMRLKVKTGKNNSKDYFKSAYWDNINEASELTGALEKDRILYVAATRAKNMLLILDSNLSRSKSPWSPLLSLLQGEDDDNELSIRRNYFDNKVYEEECDALLEERRQAIETVPHVDIQADLDLIHTKLAKGLVGTKPSYETFRPSDSKKISKDKLLGKPDYEIERIIVNNTIPFKLKQVSGIDNDRLEIGTAVHSLFETIIKDEEAVLGLIRKIDKDQLLEELDTETLTELFESFKKTSLYARIKASPQAYTEIPFSYKIGAGSNFENEILDKDTYVNGYIDLIFKEGNGWVIVDYKTCKKTDTKYSLWQSYMLQLDNYKEIWEKVSGEQVVGQEILFIEKELVAE